MSENSDPSRSFGAAAAIYEAGRPEYPLEGVEYLLAPLDAGTRRVADIGAGTGKLTRVVAGLPQTEVVAIDPDAKMLAQLQTAVPGVPTFVGTAEHLPLPDASVDAVVLGQAWHWVEPIAGSAEIGRVVRPGGVLGLIWNVRDESVDWVRQLTAIMHGSAAETLLASPEGPPIAEPFGGLESRSWSWTRTMNRDLMNQMVNSRSYVLTASDAERERVRTELDAFLDALGLTGDRTIELPYTTQAFRAIRSFE